MESWFDWSRMLLQSISWTKLVILSTVELFNCWIKLSILSTVELLGVLYNKLVALSTYLSFHIFSAVHSPSFLFEPLLKLKLNLDICSSQPFCVTFVDCFFFEKKLQLDICSSHWSRLRLSLIWLEAENSVWWLLPGLTPQEAEVDLENFLNILGIFLKSHLAI